MAEMSGKSAQVFAREIDLSGAGSVSPSGIPAGVIGTALKGPAFVPVTVATWTDFVAKFGNTSGKQFGPLAMYEWLQNASAGTYLRVLGTGDGKTRLTAAGSDSNSETIPAGGVKNAGFIVGSQQVKANGYVGQNTYAMAGNESTEAGAYDGGILGRTYYFGAFMSQSADCDLFEDAGLVGSTGAGLVTKDIARPIIRGVLMAPSGVLLSLSGNFQSATTASEVAM